MQIQKKIHVVWWSNMPTPYFIDRFNAIADRGNIDFEAWFNVEREPDRSWAIDSASWRFQSRFIAKGQALGFKNLYISVEELRQANPDVFVQEYDRPNLALGHIIAKSVALRTAFRVLRPPAWAHRTLIGEVFRHLLFRSVDGAKISGSDADQYARNYGLPKERLTRVTQSINVEHFRQALAMKAEERAAYREQMGLQGCVFLYVGRLFPGKGIESLLHAYRQLVDEHRKVSLLMVGDGVKEVYYRQLASDLPNVVFTGFVQAPCLPFYYAVADVMTFPTLGDSHGLVVDEAMAAGLPVICTDAAGDIAERLPDGQAGYVIGAGDTAALADRMRRLAEDEALRKCMSQTAQEKISANTHEKYAAEFEVFIERVMQLPPRNGLASQLFQFMGKQILRWSHPADKTAASTADAAWHQQAINPISQRKGG